MTLIRLTLSPQLAVYVDSFSPPSASHNAVLILKFQRWIDHTYQYGAMFYVLPDFIHTYVCLSSVLGFFVSEAF